MKRTLLKSAALLSSVVLASGYISYRTNGTRIERGSERDESPPALTPEQLEELFSSSKSGRIHFTRPEEPARIIEVETDVETPEFLLPGPKSSAIEFVPRAAPSTRTNDIEVGDEPSEKAWSTGGATRKPGDRHRWQGASAQAPAQRQRKIMSGSKSAILGAPSSGERR